jgi:hypothetical protein
MQLVVISGLAPAPGVLAFSSANFTTQEDNKPGALSANITVSRTDGFNGAVSADYVITAGSATAVDDYTGPFGLKVTPIEHRA